MVDDANNVAGTRSVLSRSYLASLPERAARAGAAFTGWLAYETNEVMLPLAVRRSRFYQAVIGRLTIELVGGVEGVYLEEEIGARDLLVRKTAGNVVELGSFVAVGWSPVWLLAGASGLIRIRRVEGSVRTDLAGANTRSRLRARRSCSSGVPLARE